MTRTHSLGSIVTPGVVILVIAAPLFFLRLDCALLEPEEARYAEIARQMLVEGHWLVPILHGHAYFDKPPLLYWLIIGSYRLFGVHDWAARLVSSGAAFLCVLVTYFWGRRIVGTRPALLGALMVCLSGQFVYLGRMVTMNSLVCLWVVMALALAHRALSEDDVNKKWWCLSGLACGLGILTKGPVALVLTLVPLVTFRWFTDRPVARTPGLWLGYLLAALGLAAPWFIAVTVADPDFLHYFFWVHHVERFVAPYDHLQPFWYYLPWLLLGMFPWTLLLPGMIRSLRMTKRPSDRRADAFRFFLISAAWGLLFFSLSGCKRKGYILPVMPPLALALGCYLDSLLPQAEDGIWGTLWRFPSALGYWSAAFIVGGLGVGGCVAAVNAGLLAPTLGFVIMGICAVCLAVVVAATRSRTASWLWSGMAMFVLLCGTLWLILPAYARIHSLRSQVTEIAGDRHDMPVLCYPHRWDSVSFYLERGNVEAIAPAQRDRLLARLRDSSTSLVFIKPDFLDVFRRELPPDLEFVPCGARRPMVTAGWVRHR